MEPHKAQVMIGDYPTAQFRDAMQVVTGALKTDENMWRAWKANIAMAFYDAYNREFKDAGMAVHRCANEAAEAFLKNLTNV